MLKNKIILILISFSCLSVAGQDSLNYRLDAFGSFSTGKLTPFWITNNTYGVVPLQSNNIYGRGNVKWDHKFNENFKLQTGIDLVGATKHSSDFFIQQLYTSLSYKSLHLNIGAKEYYNSLLNKNLSTGDFDYSPNARPIPEINLNIPEFTTVPYTKGILQVRGDFAVGKSTDNNYIEKTKHAGENYTIDILWHHKSLYFKLLDPKLHFPFSATIGFNHAVQWGGWTTVDGQGELPHSFSDFIRIVFGEGGGNDASIGEQINVLGNQQGTYDLKFSYTNQIFNFSAYKQHYFDDNSGMEYTNWRDGIWGLECELYNQIYVRNIVLEYINTTNQSGTMHFLGQANSRGGGNDDYYNHETYISGWSHWGRTLGNPLITPPEYNQDIYFPNNRIKAIHLGLNGEISPGFAFRVLLTGMYAWGRMSYPFLDRKNNFSSLFEFSYTPSRWKDWKLTLQTAFDNGTLYDDNFGCSLKISKSGSFCF